MKAFIPIYENIVQEYKVGKTYTSKQNGEVVPRIEIFMNGEDTLDHYPYCKDYQLLEVEVLSEVKEYSMCCNTSKIKVLRIVPRNEYNFKGYKFDDRGNLIKKTSRWGAVTSYTYDKRNNMISQTTHDGEVYTYEYDEMNNMTSQKSSSGAECTYNVYSLIES